MGLDVTAYEKIVPIGRHTEDWCADEDHHTVLAYKGFEQSTRGLILDAERGNLRVGGCVTTSGREFDFRAGSYSGYGAWRQALARAAYGVSAGEVWADPDAYRDLPFFELIHFADNEGTIGPDAAGDLAADFAENRDTVRAKLAVADDCYAEKYDYWQRAFELAAGAGMVSLH